MDILTAVYWVVGILCVGALALFGLAVLVIVGFVVVRFATRKANDAGITLSDGIDEREKAIILGMLTKHKQTKAESDAAVAMVQAAQVALNANRPVAE